MATTDLTNRINARNRSVIWALGAESLDATERATFNYTGRPYTRIEDLNYSIAECTDALWRNTLRSYLASGLDVARESHLALYFGPDRNQSWDTFTGTRADHDSWDPFASDDRWPGPAVGGYSCRVSPMLLLEAVGRHIALWQGRSDADALTRYNTR